MLNHPDEEEVESAAATECSDCNQEEEEGGEKEEVEEKEEENIGAAGIVIDGYIDDDDDDDDSNDDNISQASSEGLSQLLKLSIYHFGKCKEFAEALDQCSTDELKETDMKGRTAFINLAWYGCLDCLTKFKQIRKNINQVDDEKCTALMAASHNGHAEVVNQLLKWSADVSLRDTSKNTALHYGVSSPTESFSVECVHLLLQYYSDVNALNDTHTMPVLQAILSGNTAAVPLLINYGAKLTTADDHGLLPIVEAAYGGYVETLQLLVDNGVPINSRDSSGETALLVASREGHTDCVKFLLENNADVSAVNDSGSTALMLAHEAGNTATTKLLHAAGCPPQRNPFADSSNLRLWDICCYVIRSRLLEGNLHKNLLCLIPQLSFPQRVKNSLLENVTL